MIDLLDSLTTLPTQPGVAESAALPEGSVMFARLLDQADERNSQSGDLASGGTELPEADHTGKVQPSSPWDTRQHGASELETDPGSLMALQSILYTGADSTPKLNTTPSQVTHVVETQSNPADSSRGYVFSEDHSTTGRVNPYATVGLMQQLQHTQQTEQTQQTHQTQQSQQMQGTAQIRQGVSDSSTAPGAQAQPLLSIPRTGVQVFGNDTQPAPDAVVGDLALQVSTQGGGSIQSPLQAPVLSETLQSEALHSEGLPSDAFHAGVAQPEIASLRDSPSQRIQRDAVTHLNAMQRSTVADSIGNGGSSESAKPSAGAEGVVGEHRAAATSPAQSSLTATTAAPIPGVIAGERDQTLSSLKLKSPGALSLLSASPDAPGTEMSAPLKPGVDAGLGMLKSAEQGQSIRAGRFSTQLAERILIMHTRQLSSASIRLDPADLGRIEVQIRIHQDVAHINFQVQNAGIRDFMEQHMPRLRMAIEDAGLMLGDVDVGSREQQQHAGPEENPRYTSQQAQNTPQAQERVSSRSDWRLVDAYA